ncbi:MAG: hypothetical protein KGL39_57790 [Patescibacteria group bacterium]|nr:hypothetical protein [Patescibacteria group bacterium]
MAVQAYLQAKVSVDRQNVSPVVTFWDPMSIDEANRFIVMIESAEMQPESPANFKAKGVVTTKSRWAQKTIAADFKSHFDRVNWVRDPLMSPTLADDLTTQLNASGGGVVVDFFQPKRQFATEKTLEGWVYSDTFFELNGFFTT